jgi:hypothetical protein
MRAKINHNFTLVFDYTIAEMKHAAEEGCGFSQYLLRDIKTEDPTGKWETSWKVEDDSLFAAQFTSNSDTVKFGMATHI